MQLHIWGAIKALVLIDDFSIADIKIEKRFRHESGGDIEGLAKSIAEVGLLHPIVIDENHILQCGKQRLEACKLLGWTTISVHLIDFQGKESLKLQAQKDENVRRESFTATEIVEIGLAYEAKLKEEAEERRREKISKSRRGERDGAKLAPSQKTRDVIADFVGVSHGTWEKMRYVYEAAKSKPRKYGGIMKKLDARHTYDNRLSVNAAYSDVLQHERPKPPPMPKGQFSVLLVDPPWPYDFYLKGAPTMHYPTMTLEELIDMRDKIPAAPNSILFLWATNPKLIAAQVVMFEWDFEYRTNMVWVKDKMGTGFDARNQHELLLIGKRGDMPPPLPENRWPSVIFAPRREHSRKPDEVYAIIEKMYPDRKPYLELFARTKRGGWISWGSEINVFNA